MMRYYIFLTTRKPLARYGRALIKTLEIAGCTIKVTGYVLIGILFFLPEIGLAIMLIAD